MRSSLLTAIIICVIVGAAGGLVVAMIVPALSIIGILLGALYGLFFALLAARALPVRARVCSGVSPMRSFCGLRFRQASSPC